MINMILSQEATQSYPRAQIFLTPERFKGIK
jgi:hypothetical protein